MAGTYASEQIVLITSAVPGATLRYTTNGGGPTESDPEVPANGDVLITGTTTLKARAWVPDRAPSVVASATYTLQPAAPTVTPGTGAYVGPQTVTLSAADPQAVLRYTLDGTEPGEASPAYATPFPIGTTTTVQARAFRTDWTPSGTTTAVLTLVHGTLASPTASLAGGIYQPSAAITLGGSAGATIRYTTDGSGPTAVSTEYTGPLTFMAGVVTLKAKAFQADWTASATLSESYTVDDVPPTVWITTFPYAVNGWHSGPVTLTFVCEDAVGMASCPGPTTVTAEGDTTVSGTATDLAGHQTPASVTVHLDTAPPDVALTNPTADLTTTDTSLTLTGTVSDALSGLDLVECNGEPATLDQGVATCTVPLRPGRNGVVLLARDAAGHVISRGIRVMRTGTSTTLRLTPAVRTQLVGEGRELSLIDEYGSMVTGATWTASDSGFVELSTDDPPVLTALAAGTVTITAMKNGMSATATITVVAGTSLPDGTTRWSVAPTPGLELSAPIYTHPVDDTVPDLFAVETDLATNTTMVRALTATGTQQWTEAAPGEPVMGDSFGAVVARLPGGTGLARFAGPSTAMPWRYASPGQIWQPAQGPDGTIYAIEEVPGIASNGQPIDDLAVAVIDGQTGQLRARVPIARDFVEFHAAWEGRYIEGVGYCHSGRWEMRPHATNPIVGEDGSGYFQVSQITRVDHGYCKEANISRLDNHSVRLVKVTPAGVVTEQDLYRFIGPYDQWWPEMGQVLPDGLAASWRRGAGIRRGSRGSRRQKSGA